MKVQFHNFASSQGQKIYLFKKEPLSYRSLTGVHSRSGMYGISPHMLLYSF